MDKKLAKKPNDTDEHMNKEDTIIKSISVAKDLGIQAALFNILGDLPGTEYRPTERERQRVRDHVSHVGQRHNQ